MGFIQDLFWNQINYSFTFFFPQKTGKGGCLERELEADSIVRDKK